MLHFGKNWILNVATCGLLPLSGTHFSGLKVRDSIWKTGKHPSNDVFWRCGKLWVDWGGYVRLGCRSAEGRRISKGTRRPLHQCISLLLWKDSQWVFDAFVKCMLGIVMWENWWKETQDGCIKTNSFKSMRLEDASHFWLLKLQTQQNETKPTYT